MQGGAVSLAEQAQALTFRPDLILASDMLNLPTFLGLTRNSLSNVPVALYCHENQLTYPLPLGEKRDLTYGMINWLSMLAADRILFNSRYHLENWFEELPRLLKHFPDHTHLHRIAEVQAKTSVLPVGCDLRRFDPVPDPDSPIPESALILWNQRWEYDKDPETFFKALYLLAEDGFDFQVALAGKSHRQTAPEFEAAQKRLEPRVVHFGHANETQYAQLLRRADVVISSAIHEFFGIAVIEAIYCGCFPVLPHRLAYPELLPSSHHEACLYKDFEGLLDRLCWVLVHPERARALATELRRAIARFDWTAMGLSYVETMTALVSIR